MAIKYKNKEFSQSNLVYNPGETKVAIHMDISFLDILICYLFTKSKAITKANLLAIRKFFECVDLSMYTTNARAYARIVFIKKVLDCILTEGLERKSIILEACRIENDPANAEILQYIDQFQPLSLNEIHTVNKQISDRLKFIFVIYFKEKFSQLFFEIDQGKFDSMAEINEYMKNISSSFLNEVRKAENTSSHTVFSLKPEVMDAFVTELINKLTDPDMEYRTGIRALNDMMCNGIKNGRLYLWLGLTGGWKSSMLLQCARWIKIYNNPKPHRKDPSSIPTVLLITTENTVEESVQRLFNMSVSDQEIQSFSPEEALQVFKSSGKMTMRDGSTDIVIMYFGNNELETADLYTIIEDLEDDNREVVALIFDYLKRIRPSEPAPMNDERIQLKHVSNELKNLAVKLNIPVITANQINRAGNAAIDSAAASGKEDLGRFLGRANIALSWDTLENVDWCAIINMEKEKRTGTLYLTIKRIKIRYRDTAQITYINHPFMDGSTIRLIDDINLPKSQSKNSLSSDMEGISFSNDHDNGRKRKVVSEASGISNEFDFARGINQ